MRSPNSCNHSALYPRVDLEPCGAVGLNVLWIKIGRNRNIHITYIIGSNAKPMYSFPKHLLLWRLEELSPLCFSTLHYNTGQKQTSLSGCEKHKCLWDYKYFSSYIECSISINTTHYMLILNLKEFVFATGASGVWTALSGHFQSPKGT